MPRKASPPPPQRRDLTPREIAAGIDRISKRIEDVERFDPASITERWSGEVMALQTAIEDTLAAIFGTDSDQFQRYRPAARLDNGPIFASFEGSDPKRDPQTRKYLSDGKTRSLLLLRQAIRGLEESLPQAAVPSSRSAAAEPAVENKIFIVHGHDEGAREMVARFIEKIGFEAVILHERASQGRTIIEKVEHQGAVRFAIVILTGDDVGSTVGGEVKSRARQNVILELGYFVGRLGRDRVCALKRGDLELPTDFGGVVYLPLEGEWKIGLARELKAAGFNVDWQLVMED